MWTPMKSLHAGWVHDRTAETSAKGPPPQPSWVLALLAAEIRKVLSAQEVIIWSLSHVSPPFFCL